MAQSRNGHHQALLLPPEYWDLLQSTLVIAISGCNDIAAAVEAHQRLGKYDAEQLLDKLNGDVREIRKLLEIIEVPF